MSSNYLPPIPKCPHGNDVGNGLICLECIGGAIDQEELQRQFREDRKNDLVYKTKMAYKFVQGAQNDICYEEVLEKGENPLAEAEKQLEKVLDTLDPEWRRKEEELSQLQEKMAAEDAEMRERILTREREEQGEQAAQEEGQ